MADSTPPEENAVVDILSKLINTEEEWIHLKKVQEFLGQAELDAPHLEALGLPARVGILVQGKEFIALAGTQVRRLFSLELFREMAGISGDSSPDTLAALLHDRWTDLADAVASLHEPIEAYSVVGSSTTSDSGSPPGRSVQLAFLAVGRDPSRTVAREKCSLAYQGLWTLLSGILDYAELVPIREKTDLERLARHLKAEHFLEIKRRLENVRVSHGLIRRGPFGFTGQDHSENPPKPGESDDLQLRHLFPWIPSDDPWRRLVEVLARNPGPAALVVHFRGWREVPEGCAAQAREALAAAESIASGDKTVSGTVLQRQAAVLVEESLRRSVMTEGPMVAARVFVGGDRPPAPAFLATVEAAIDDASVRKWQSGSDLLFAGGATHQTVSCDEVLAPLDSPALEDLFGPREASAILRSPMSAVEDLPGVKMNRARTAEITGISGNDCPLGLNQHRGTQTPVSLDDGVRFRHTYIVGQTGTGKSTLLLHMILHDVA